MTLALQIIGFTGLFVIVWSNRQWIRANPIAAAQVTLRTVRVVGITVGLLLISASIATPSDAFSLVAWVWNDPRFFVHLGASRQTALALSGISLLIGALAVYRVGVHLISTYSGP
ncbi:hypothetical protein [Natrinema gelatinilyticum]|uniref:hypothetical protein n=1 Tax=Natrinema gelatinilyticum TaxID=2961571 RepID=UPI0020C5AED5|nr:hypothetical protein [Natrinema gelatinilyticum]